jgi:hypothetical protein
VCSVRFGAFAHDPHRVLVGIRPLAFVRDELFLDVSVCILRSAYSLGICRELGIATFTNAEHRDIILSFDDPKLAFRHALSLPQGGPDCYPVEIQPAPLPLLEIVGVMSR